MVASFGDGGTCESIVGGVLSDVDGSCWDDPDSTVSGFEDVDSKDDDDAGASSALGDTADDLGSGNVSSPKSCTSLSAAFR